MSTFETILARYGRPVELRRRTAEPGVVTAAFLQAMAGKNNYLVTNTQEALLYQQYSIYRLRDKTLVRHPWYLYDLTQSALDVSDADMLRYFGSEKPALIEVPAESWETYKAANQ